MPMQNPMQFSGRVTAAITAALVITAALFWIMQAAIKQEDINVKDPQPSPNLEIVRLKRDEQPATKDLVKPPKPEPVKKTPPPPRLKLTGGGLTEIVVDNTPPPAVIDDIGNAAAIDGDPLPLFTVAPEYPRRPLTQGIEGWVVVEFLIDELGRVQNARVIDAQPQNVFDRAALKAVERYKYKPKVLHGKALPVHGVRQRIVFDLS